MDNVKTITAREIKQIASTFYEKTKYITWHGKRIKINPMISFHEAVSFIQSVLNSSTSSKDNVLVLESVEFIFLSKFLEVYANIKLPDNLEEQYEIIYGSDLVEKISEEVNKSQLLSIADIIHAYTGIHVWR